MADLTRPLISELEQEAKTTRRVIERVPADRLDFQPHPKAMTLGQLALHVARIPGTMSKMGVYGLLRIALPMFGHEIAELRTC